MRALVILTLVLLYSCADTQQMEQDWIEKKVEEKVYSFIEGKKKDCLDELMEKVINDADSIMLKDAYLDLPDSLVIPSKRSRPDSPDKDFPEFETPSNPVKVKLDSL